LRHKHKTALNLHAHSVLYVHKLTTTRHTLKKPVALKVLIWSRGRLAILQILTSSFFPWWRRLTAPRANVSPFPLLM